MKTKERNQGQFKETEPFIESCVKELKKRLLEDSGFASRVGGSYRPDSTAWAIIALSAAGVDEEILDLCRSRLLRSQNKDGRIIISPAHPEAFWATPIVILAWHESSDHKEQQTRAIRFLLGTTGVHWPKEQTPDIAHDPNIRGWPWIGITHSWVEPTALCIQSLKVTGYENHERVQEGIDMLLDRQLPHGGWNYGNKLVFGRELRPMPSSTGIALASLSGSVLSKEITNSLDYLKKRITSVRSPLSLSWSLLGLGAWGERPPEARKWLEECWRLRERHGSYDTSLISLMLIARLGSSGLMSLIGKQDI